MEARQSSFDDGNRRREFSGGWQEQWWAGPSARFSTTARLWTGANSIDNAVYFNPPRATSVSGEANLEWFGFRGYNTSLSHLLSASVGSFAQQGYDSLGTFGLRYELRYRLDDQTELSTGYGMSRRPFDGVQESFRNFSLNFNRRF